MKATQAPAESSAPSADISPEQIEDWIRDHDAATLHQSLSASFQQKVSQQEVEQQLQNFWNKGETPKRLSSMTLNGADKYVWTDAAGQKGVMAMLADNQIISMQFIPLVSAETDLKPTTNSYRMPFQDKWLVFWGGRNELINYHYAYPNQRYAYDLVITHDGFSFKGDPTKNESYYAFGQPVVAPLEGKVVGVVNDIPDNYPVGQMNEQQPEGNYVILDHGNDEYSLLAHFKQGTIEVKQGDVVKAGQLLGECGNSGNSSEAHIHFQVSDAPSLTKGMSIPIQFEHDADPLQGDVIRGQS
ncbi:M23 family metallopeptidase [Paenibacillus sp. MER TA 81-3]|uniref:M23 family metallopeptidase n=1 Tax=Paenibacillus sp. MER TA 81-3 TaxID=2939573 RepID=UPI00204113B0|nr:M23 family metallopeptidase [Paenibacillus sp. MER TA 81-3]MCM3339630.1 M23 family metallopeptidase [Paenibacillus sp. MER TA 81-3]